jgi:hypothetical protein
MGKWWKKPTPAQTYCTLLKIIHTFYIGMFEMFNVHVSCLVTYRICTQNWFDSLRCDAAGTHVLAAA